MTDEERANRKKYDSVDSMREFAKWYRNKWWKEKCVEIT